MEPRTKDEDRTIREAKRILKRRLRRSGAHLKDPNSVRNYLRLELAERTQEVFCCVFLDTRHRVLAFRELFHGSIDGCSVHPREVVREALALNAAAVILAHNHPSGVAEPSRADQRITERLRSALALIDVRVLDHFVIGEEVTSFAEHGLL